LLRRFDRIQIASRASRGNARALAAINHPNIAAIYGIDEQDDTSALVLELVEGASLATRLRRGPIPIDEAVAIAKQIANALGAAHEKDIIHRDLKPANIMITPDGVVKVLDFGLAKVVEDRTGSDLGRQRPLPRGTHERA
jgi:eukaryotic-like serine/threonine-protein kinase